MRSPKITKRLAAKGISSGIKFSIKKGSWIKGIIHLKEGIPEVVLS